MGEKGRSQLYAWPDIAIVQVIKRRLPSGLEIERRIVQGCPRQVDAIASGDPKSVGRYQHRLH